MGDDGDSYVELVKASGKCIVEFYQVSIGGERLPFVNPWTLMQVRNGRFHLELLILRGMSNYESEWAREMLFPSSIAEFKGSYERPESPL